MSKAHSKSWRQRRNQRGELKKRANVKRLKRKATHCTICRIRFLSKHAKTIDHIIPLSKEGLNHISNIQIVCQPCNVKKADN